MKKIKRVIASLKKFASPDLGVIADAYAESLWEAASVKRAARSKIASGDVDYAAIVLAAAKAVLVSHYADCTEQAAEEESDDYPDGGNLTDTPWGPGSDLMNYQPKMNPQLEAAIDKILKSMSPTGQAGIEADFLKFEEETGEDEDTYGHYLAMESMGHGVGLGDYGYKTSLDSNYKLENVDHWLSAPSPDKILLHLAVGTSNNIEFDVTGDLLDYATDKLLTGGQTVEDDASDED